MRAWVLHETTGPDAYHLEDVKVPEPGPGEVRVRLAAAALNHLDLWVSYGRPTPPLPHIAGADGAGTVDALGEGVAGLAIGDAVVIDPTLTCGSCGPCTEGDPMDCAHVRIVGEHRWGTLAEYVVLPASNAVPRPGELPWTDAAAVGVITSTALRMLRRGRVTAGSTVLVAGVGGGVGAAALSVAVALGATVYVTSTKPATLERAATLGATGGFDSRADFAADVRTATDGRGVDCVIEHVGPATWENSMRSLARGGRLVTCGGTTGQSVELSLPFLFWRQIEVIGSTMANPREFADAMALVEAGKVPALVDSVYAFDDLPAALASLERGGRFGKVVVQVADAAQRV